MVCVLLVYNTSIAEWNLLLCRWTLRSMVDYAIMRESSRVDGRICGISLGVVAIENGVDVARWRVLKPQAVGRWCDVRWRMGSWGEYKSGSDSGGRRG